MPLEVDEEAATSFGVAEEVPRDRGLATESEDEAPQVQMKGKEYTGTRVIWG